MRYMRERGIVSGLQGQTELFNAGGTADFIEINSVPGCVDSIPGRFAFIQKRRMSRGCRQTDERRERTWNL